jgi:maleylacetoacetate isomerase
MAIQDAKLTLYTYFRSSCSTRVRTAAALKGIALHYEYVNLLKGEQTAAPYVSDLNPSGTVPTLVAQQADGSKVLVRQSVAMLEFLEEAFPDARPLLPAPDRPAQRALVRDLVGILTADFQPKTNLSVLRRVGALGVPAQDWCREQMVPALRACEAVLETCAGRFCVGDDVTLADVVLAPAVEGALRWTIDLDLFPEVKRVYETVSQMPEFVRADWRHQEDTPLELREQK